MRLLASPTNWKGTRVREDSPDFTSDVSGFSPFFFDESSRSIVIGKGFISGKDQEFGGAHD